MDSLLKVDGLSVEFLGKQTCYALRELNFAVPHEGTLGIVGESGSGKSTIAAALLGLLPPQGRLTSGSAQWRARGVSFDLLSSSKAGERVRGQSIALVSQNPGMALNPYLRVETQMVEHLMWHEQCSRRKAIRKALKLLTAVQIDKPEAVLRRYPHQFSGGQQQRIAIAMALMTDPDLLIADEPTTALDTTVQAQVLKLFKELQKELGMAMIFISHDLRVISQVADEVLVMHEGQAVETGTMAQILYQPKSEHTKNLGEVLPKKRVSKPKKSAKDTLISAQNLHYSIAKRLGSKERKTILSDIDLQIPKGEIIGMVGESGAGKSTLARALLRLVPIDSGTINFDSQAIHELDSTEMLPLRARMQMVFQNPYTSLNPRRTVYETLYEALSLHRVVAPEQIPERIATLLDEVELPRDSMQRYPHQFSGGQCQRISIARAISTEPELLIADEPLSALDISTQSKIVLLLKKLVKERGLSILLITHDLSVVRQACTQVAVMYDGNIVEYGDNQQIFKEPRHEHTRALLQAMPELPAKPRTTH